MISHFVFVFVFVLGLGVPATKSTVLRLQSLWSIMCRNPALIQERMRSIIFGLVFEATWVSAFSAVWRGGHSTKNGRRGRHAAGARLMRHRCTGVREYLDSDQQRDALAAASRTRSGQHTQLVSPVIML